MARGIKSETPQSDLNVLLAGIAERDAEEIVRAIEKARYRVVAQRVATLAELQSSLDTASFDIILAGDSDTAEASAPRLPSHEVLRLLRPGKNGVNTLVPCIILAEEFETDNSVDLMRRGAGDCIAREDRGRLPAAIKREILESRARRQLLPQTDAAAPAGETREYSHRATAAFQGATSTEFSENGIAPQSAAAFREAQGEAANRIEFFPMQDETRDDGWQLGSFVAPAPQTASARDAESASPRPVRVLWELSRAVARQRETAEIVQEISRRLRPLMPFSAVGLTLRAAAETDAAGTAAAAPDSEESSDALQIELRADPGGVRGTLNFTPEANEAFTATHRELAQAAADCVAEAMAQTREQAQEKSAAHRAFEKFDFLLNNLDLLIFEIEPRDLRFSYVNARAAQWLGYVESEWLESADLWSRLLVETDRARVLAELRRLATEGGQSQIEFSLRAADGNVFHARNFLVAETRDGAVQRIDGVMLDVTAAKNFQSALLESNAILKATQDAAADGIFLIGNGGQVMSFNERFLEMWRVPRGTAGELHARGQVMAFVLSQLKNPEEFHDTINDVFENPQLVARDKQTLTRGEISLKDGRIFLYRAAPALSEEGAGFGWVWTFCDITERKKYEIELERQATHDTLTGLPNRVLFFDRLKAAIEQHGDEGKMLAVLFLDLDRFKVINDSLGHEFGDLLLTELSHRLRACIRPGDTCARFGGDEFTFLINNVTESHEATRVAERIQTFLQMPFSLGGHELYSSASIGIILSESRHDRAEELLRHADVAMYRAKKRGGAQYEIFDTEMSTQALERLQLEIDLRQALRGDQLRAYYQPLVDARSGRITGVEALLRWEHPRRGLISPADFIPLAEETGLILPIGKWILGQACRQMRDWQRRREADGESGVPLYISVNLSVKQFHQENLVPEIAEVLRDTELPPSSLVLEITESVMLNNEAATMNQLAALKKLGVRLAIDDFGTGYSSLSYLERFELDILKIDRSFVSRINGRGDHTAIARAVSTLGQALGVHVTAEGVETAEQMTQLRAMGCHTGQGYFFARPLPADEATALLLENPKW